MTVTHGPSLKIRRHVKHLGQEHFQAGGTDLQHIPTARINFSFRLIPTMFSCYKYTTLLNSKHILCTPCVSSSPYNISTDSDVRYTRSTIQISNKIKDLLPGAHATCDIYRWLWVADLHIFASGGCSVKASCRYVSVRQNFKGLREKGAKLSRQKLRDIALQHQQQ